MSTFVRSILLPIALIAFATTARSHPNDSAAPSTAQYQDLLYFGASRPVVIRLHLLVDGQAFQLTWSSYAQQLFAAADRDGDGKLTDADRQIPAAADNPLANEVTAILSLPGLLQADVDSPDGAISPAEFTAFIADRRGGAFQAPGNISNAEDQQLLAPTPVQNANAGSALFKALDRQRDSQLSLDDLQSAVDSLSKLDFDGDGACSADELDHLRSPFQGVQILTQPTAGPGIPLQVLGAGEPSTEIVDRLLRSYGGGLVIPPESLSIEQLGHRTETLAAFDADHNSRLDREELRYWVTHPAPHVELAIRVGQRGENESPVEVRVPPTLERLTVKVTPSGLVSLVDGSVQLEFGVPPDERTAETLQRAFVQSFKMFDYDGNGYLDRNETSRAPYFDVQFTQFDRDADGRMFEAEMLAAAPGEIAAALSRTAVSVENRGQDLFEILDTTRDRRISQREFIESLDRFSLWDANDDGQLTPGEVPQLYQLSFERGAPPLPSLARFNRGNNRGPNDPAMAGPVWFQRMDRNSDGDVARTEFVGTPAQFKSLDANNDGLIDAAEAAVTR